MVDYELMNEIADNDEQEIRELKEEYEIIARFEAMEEEEKHKHEQSLNADEFDNGYY